MATMLGRLWPLFFGMLLVMLGNGLQGTLLGIRGGAEGFSTTGLGWVMSGYYIGFLAGGVIIPHWLYRAGHVRVYAALAALASAVILIHPVFLITWVWVGLRIVTGFCFVGIYLTAESWLNAVTGNQERGRVLAFYMMIQFVGLSGGQLLLTVAAPGEFTLFALVGVLISLAPLGLLLRDCPAPERFTPGKRCGVGQLLRISGAGGMGAICGGALNGMLLGMGPVYADRTGWSTSGVATFMTVLVVGGALGQWPLGQLADRLPRRLVLAVITLGSVVIAGWLARFTDPTSQLIGFGLVGGLCFSLYPLSLSLVNDFLNSSQIVAVGSAFCLASGIGSSLSPLIAAWALDEWGGSGFLGVIAGFNLLMLGAVLPGGGATVPPASDRPES